MRFALTDLLQSPCPNLWHALLGVGQWEGTHVVVPDTIAAPILATCNEPPADQPADPSPFTARLRTEAQKAPLRAICAQCEHHRDGQCQASSCCGGRIPVEVRLNLTSTACPKGNWPAT